MKPALGITLIELMVTLVIVGVLASIALPMYGEYVTRGRLVEAFSTLSAQRVRMEQFFQDQRTYVGACVAGTVAPPMTNTASFTFACNDLTATTYTLTATGQASVTGFTFTLDQNNTQRTTAVASGWTAPSPNTCWVRKKGGSC